MSSDPLQCSCLENPRDRGAWWAAIYGVAQSQTRLKRLSSSSSSTSRSLGFPGGAGDKEPACQCRRCKRRGFDPWVGKIPWSTKWQPAPVFLPRKLHGQRSLAGYSPWGRRVGHAAVAAKSIQSCPTLCDPIDGSPPGSPVPGILQARTLEGVAISFSNA